jgi:hypothetical protein
MRGRVLPAGVLTATLTAMLLTGCGGSDHGGSTGSQSGAASAPAGKQQAKPTGARQENSGAGSGDTGRKRESHFEGGEEEVEAFGSEAQGSVKGKVLATERSYLSAIATKSYEQACARLAPAVTGSLHKMVKGSGAGCGEILPKLLSPTVAAVARQQLQGEVVRVRVEGEQAFVIFHAPGARLWTLPLSNEGGGWKVATLAPTVLAPSAATLGE